jgi:hypothetical protein
LRSSLTAVIARMNRRRCIAENVRSPRPRWRGLFPLGILAAVLVAAAPGVWGDPGTGGIVPAAGPAARDLRLALQVRRALQEDSALAHANVGVKVTDGMVRLWGPVPSLDLGRRAAERARTLAGVRGVVNELYVSTALDEPATIRFPTQPEPGTSSQSASPDPATGSLGKVTGRTPVIALPPSGRTATARPRAPEDGCTSPGPAPGTLPDLGTAPSPVPARSSPREPTVSLLPPVATAPPKSLPDARQLPQAPTTAGDGLAQALDRLRQSDPRYRGIRLEVRGSTVVLSAADDVPGEHVMALAQAVSRLSGVERVLIQNATPGSR